MLGPWGWEENQNWIHCSFSFIPDFFPGFYLNALNLPNWVEKHEWGRVVPVFLCQLEFPFYCPGFNSNLRVNNAQPSISGISKMSHSNTILRMGEDVIWLFWEKGALTISEGLMTSRRLYGLDARMWNFGLFFFFFWWLLVELDFNSIGEDSCLQNALS